MVKEDIIYDYSKLNGKIIEVFGTHREFAKAMGLSSKSESDKMLQKVPFKQPEIDKAIRILYLTKTDIPSYFFEYKV